MRSTLHTPINLSSITIKSPVAGCLIKLCTDKHPHEGTYYDLIFICTGLFIIWCTWYIGKSIFIYTIHIGSCYNRESLTMPPCTCIISYDYHMPVTIWENTAYVICPWDKNYNTSFVANKSTSYLILVGKYNAYKVLLCINYMFYVAFLHALIALVSENKGKSTWLTRLSSSI